jgi:hypothetical protein
VSQPEWKPLHANAQLRSPNPQTGIFQSIAKERSDRDTAGIMYRPARHCKHEFVIQALSTHRRRTGHTLGLSVCFVPLQALFPHRTGSLSDVDVNRPGTFTAIGSIAMPCN